jgi:GntR family transcriptional regulator/MocR family aminotransferase
VVHLIPYVIAMIDRRCSKTLHAQIAAAIVPAIREAVIAPGSRLPSSRDLAEALQVSRDTVVAAYETLQRQSLVTSLVGSGTRVIGSFPVVRVSESTWRTAMQESRYPRVMANFCDADGNVLYLSSR